MVVIDKITREMVELLNRQLADMSCGWEYELRDEFGISPVIKIRTRDPNGWVESSINNMTKKYYAWLEDFFQTNFNIKLEYNNTKSMCWAEIKILEETHDEAQ